MMNRNMEGAWVPESPGEMNHSSNRTTHLSKVGSEQGTTYFYCIKLLRFGDYLKFILIIIKLFKM